MTNARLVLYSRYFKNPAGDLAGGLIAAIVALPLCLAFGVASGLGAGVGLYGAIAVGIFAALLGGTPAQCSGPTGPMTVIAAALYAAYPDRPELLFASAFAAGLLQIAMGYLKLGELVQYMPYPVISGFMTGIGTIIVCIELGPLFGLPSSGNVISALQDADKIFAQPNHAAMFVSALVIALIYLLPRVTRRIPSSLAALLIATVIAEVFKLDLPRIGSIPEGLPVPRVPAVHLKDLHVILQNGLTLAVLGAIDSLLTSVVMDKVTGRRHNSNQELVGQGAGNMVAGLIGGLPGAGATMRSMVAVGAGGTTYLTGVIHGVVLLVILLGFGSTAAKIPLAALAGILLTVGISIMDWRVLRTLKHHPRADIVVMGLVLGLTLFVDLIVAVLAGIAVASIIFVKQLTDAKPSTLDNIEGLDELNRRLAHIPDDVRQKIYAYQFNGPLFFGEAKNLREAVDKLIDAKYIILRFYNVPLIDQTGAFAVEQALDRWEARGTKVLCVGMQTHVREALEKTGVIRKIDLDKCFETYEDAVAAIGAFETTGASDGQQITGGAVN